MKAEIVEDLFGDTVMVETFRATGKSSSGVPAIRMMKVASDGGETKTIAMTRADWRRICALIKVLDEQTPT